MIRYTYIKNQVLKLYNVIPQISFPLNVKQIIDYITNCKYMSYQQFAQINNCTVEEVIQICNSKSGCSHYDVTRNRYLILCNHSLVNNNVARQLWTCGHEVGHILCNHHKILVNNENDINNPEYEAEADFFAATLLAPFPMFKLLDIQSAEDIQTTFGLSAEASKYRYNQYLKWLKTRVKTAWENDMIRVYKSKCA